MRRLVALALAVVVGGAALLLPEPDSPALPSFGDGGPDVATSSAGVWYCPLATATLDRDTMFSVVAAEVVTAGFTLLNPMPAAEPDRTLLRLSGPGAASLQLSEVALRGEAPSFVEFSAEEAAAFAVVVGPDAVATTTCVSSVPKIWHLLGGSTQEGGTVTLRLFNPFPEIAKTSILAVSEFGAEPLPDLQSFVVPARSWRDIAFEDRLRFRDALSFTLTLEEGVVLPAIVVGTGDGEAAWVGTGLNRTWDYPVVRIAGMTADLVVTNPGPSPVTVVLDVFTPEGVIPEAKSVEIDAGSLTLIPLDELGDGPMGIRLRSPRPVAAAAIASGGVGIAGGTGSAAPSTRWLVPGARPGPEAVTSLWLLNPGENPVTVTVRPLGASADGVDKVLVGPGAVRQFIAPEGVDGYIVDALEPISVAWSVQNPDGIAFAAGVPLGG